MTIAARVHNHQIVLPANLDIPDGAEVQITLPEPISTSPEPPTAETDGNPMAGMQEFIGALNSLPADATERHNELAHGRERRPL